MSDKRDAMRYRHLRNKDIEEIHGEGGMFVGQIPENMAFTGKELDEEIDKEMGNGR